MSVNRAEIVDHNFRDFLKSWSGDVAKTDPGLPIAGALTGTIALELFESQVLSRQIDYMARKLRAAQKAFYTIGSAGHEGNVVLGRLTRPTDPAFLHYRSGALMQERARHNPKQDFVYDTLLSHCASADDPTSGGRHKVWGSRPLWVPPQTSTIASHLPKAVGLAVAIERAKRLKLAIPIPYDSIAICTFGDASVNHAVASTAFKSSQWSAFQHLPVPVLFVCEDNGIGISVWTPKRWVENHFSNQPDLAYFRANGLDLVDAYNKTAEAVEHCRSKRVPVFLHMETVRLLGHAGSDVETEYLSASQIEAFEAIDPLIHSAKILLEAGVATSAELLRLYDKARERVEKSGERASRRPRLETPEKIMEALAPYHPAAVEKESKRAVRTKEALASEKKPRHMAVLINRALQEMMVKYPEMLIFGEDVAKKGGVYHVTTGLQKQFGVGRVFNTLLDETTILGLAIGAAHIGFLPVPEIQYLAYYHNAEDQIRGEAGSLQFFSNAQFQNPMVIRVASFGYQKGFGGHFHNDNSIAALRDIPGIVIAAPSRGDDAVKMFRTAMALAKVDGRVVFFLEPIALYMTKDLYEDGDGGWSFDYPEAGASISIGEPRIYREDSRDLTIVTYANGVHMSLRAAKILEKKHKVKAKVLDLRWLNPLPFEAIRREAGKTRCVLVVDECRRTGSVSEAILADLAEWGGGKGLTLGRLSAEDSYIPLGPAAEKILPSEASIIKEALRLAKRRGA